MMVEDGVLVGSTGFTGGGIGVGIGSETESPKAKIAAKIIELSNLK